MTNEMTNEEAIKFLELEKESTKTLWDSVNHEGGREYFEKSLEVINMAIKALKQQSSYNSIKTELDHVIDEIIIRIEQTRDKDKLCEYPYNRCINIIKEEIKNVN